jgi:hypothetical protein
MVSALTLAGWHVRCAQRSVGPTPSNADIVTGLELGPSTDRQAALNAGSCASCCACAPFQGNSAAGNRFVFLNQRRRHHTTCTQRCFGRRTMARSSGPDGMKPRYGVKWCRYTSCFNQPDVANRREVLSDLGFRPIEGSCCRSASGVNSRSAWQTIRHRGRSGPNV